MSATKTISRTKKSPKKTSQEASTNATAVQEPKALVQTSEDVIVVKRSKDATDYFHGPWRTLKAAPLAFLAVVLLSGALGYAVASLTADQSIQLSTDTRPLSAGQYSALSNRELRVRTVNHVAQLRSLLLEWAIEASQADVVAQVQAAPTASKQQMVWEEYVASSAAGSNRWLQAFENELKPEAIQLRAELLRRLGGTDQEQNGASLYAAVSSPVEIRQILDELTQLAEELLQP